jgi:hypothetical protein
MCCTTLKSERLSRRFVLFLLEKLCPILGERTNLLLPLSRRIDIHIHWRMKRSSSASRHLKRRHQNIEHWVIDNALQCPLPDSHKDTGMVSGAL